jgi:hypothetical protein
MMMPQSSLATLKVSDPFNQKSSKISWKKLLKDLHRSVFSQKNKMKE